MVSKNDTIFIAGHNGLVGSSVLKKFLDSGFKKIITVNKKELDLRNFFNVKKFFKKKKIDYMIMAAARAGGIMANLNNQKDFFIENVEIQNSLLQLALEKKIKRTIFLGTSCIYPKFSKIPIKEEYLLTGKLEKTNQCYALAKISGIKLCETLYEDHNLDLVCLMPTNVYGLNDNFDKDNGHVIPAMITKIYEAKKNSRKSIKLLGTGKPMREFIHSDDLADAILFCLNSKNTQLKKKFNNKLPILNVGTNDELSIKNLSKLISELIGYKGLIKFDKKFPDGTYRKKLNTKRINNLGWYPKIKLKTGLKKVIEKRISQYS
jgi:GDP-L-fucose synthase